jgi:hypothetical protein
MFEDEWRVIEKLLQLVVFYRSNSLLVETDCQNELVTQLFLVRKFIEENVDRLSAESITHRHHLPDAFSLLQRSEYETKIKVFVTKRQTNERFMSQACHDIFLGLAVVIDVLHNHVQQTRAR